MLRRKDRFSDDLDSHPELFGPDDSDARALLQAVLSLPDKYKLPVYLYYYEGYSSVEIAGLLKKPQSTVRTYLGKARQLLKDALTGDRT